MSDSYQPDRAGDVVKQMVGAKQARDELAEIDADTRDFLAAMRHAVHSGDWQLQPPARERALEAADYIERALPIRTRRDAARLARRLRDVGFTPSWEREHG